MSTLKPYTVILLYPDYAADSFGHDTYIDCVQAQSAEKAAQRCKQQAYEANDDIEEPDDFHCLAVIRGVHDIVYEDPH